MTAMLWSQMTDEQRAAAVAELRLDLSPSLMALLEADDRWLVRYDGGGLEVRAGLWPADVKRGLRLGGTP